MYNSTFANAPLDDAIATAADIGSTFADALAEFAPAGSVVVGAGEELSFGAGEQAVRAGGPIVLTLQAPSMVGFLVSVLGRLVGTQLELMADGYVAAAMMISGCYSDVKAAHDLGSWTRALTTCVTGIDDAIAGHLDLDGAGEYPASRTRRRACDVASVLVMHVGAALGKTATVRAASLRAFSAAKFIALNTGPTSAR